jgi:hypothetical protein
MTQYTVLHHTATIKHESITTTPYTANFGIILNRVIV